jgi:hypothetical protein
MERSAALGDEGVTQPLIRYQDIPADDVAAQIERTAGDDAEQVKRVIEAFADAGAARYDEGDDDGDDWDPEPATLRDGETRDDDAHARRNAEQLRIAREALDSDDESDDTDADETEAVADGGIATVGDELPANETVRLITGITRLLHTPRVIEGETSGTGKTIAVEDNGSTVRLDSETIFSGDSEFRDARYYELYTPGRLRSKQRSNKQPGPRRGTDSVADADDLPAPTHWPDLDEPADAPDVCPNCGDDSAPWTGRKVRPMCHACGELVPEEGADEDDETPDKWDLSRLSRGDVLILENYAGEFVITRVHTFVGTDTVNRLEVAKRDGGQWAEYTIKKIAAGEKNRLRVSPPDETAVMINVDDPEHAHDFEKIREDMEMVRRYIRDSRDH